MRERILRQTRDITHVVAEFLKYARPLEIPDDMVTLQTVVERVVAEVGEALPQSEDPFRRDNLGRWRETRDFEAGAPEPGAECSGKLARRQKHGGKVLVRGEVARGDEAGSQADYGV